MDKRRKPVDKETARKQRTDLYEAIDRGESSVQEAVKRMRKISRLTQSEFAAHRKVSVKVIKEIERGIANPTVNTLNQIGSFFGLEVTFVRAEKLHAKSESLRNTQTAEDLSGQTRRPSALQEVDRIVQEMEKIRRLTTLPASLQNALQGSEALEAVKRHSQALKAVQDARQIIETAEKIQQQFQVLQELPKWLKDMDNLSQLLQRLQG